MAMNLSNINSTPLELNLSIFNGTDIVKNVADTTNNVTYGLFGVFILMVVYIILIYILTKEEGTFRLDLIKASCWSSGIVFIIGVTMLTSGLITALYSVIWFGLVLLVSLYLAHQQKENGG